MFGNKKCTEECYINKQTFECSNIYSCPILYVHQDITDSLELYKIGREFVSVNARRMHYFEKF